jgi:magnesium chelatase subunit I
MTETLDSTQNDGLGPHNNISSLQDLIDAATGKNLSISSLLPEGDVSNQADLQYFPFFAIVGQREMKLALMLSLINPSLGGVLLLGSRGTGKTTAVRSLIPLLPEVERSTCYFGCLPEDIEEAGIDVVCPDCAQKYANGISLTHPDSVRMIEVPLNTTLDDVIGSADPQPGTVVPVRITPGLLSQADKNILYIDEINLLPDVITDAILDAAAQGHYIVKRAMASGKYRARFTLIGSMNPEEGRLRPQIMDRFGLRVIVQRLETQTDRIEAYRRVHTFLENPYRLVSQYSLEMLQARNDIILARNICPNVELDDETAAYGVGIIQDLKINSLRADVTLFEAARAYCAADGRTKVCLSDIQAVAPLALRLRRSKFMDDYLATQEIEEQEIEQVITTRDNL